MSMQSYLDNMSDLIFSGGGFLAGVTATALYAKSQGKALDWPWQRRTDKQRTTETFR